MKLLTAAAFLVLVPLRALALQTVTLPPDSDGYVPFDNSDASDKLSADKPGGMKVDGLGSFHFSMSRDPGWPNDPGYYYHPGSSSPAGFGSANVPGSEFYTSGYPYEH